jgi:hypothetical protein
MDIQNLITRVSKLSVQEQKHFYKILIKNGVNYSKNLNGYFFNLRTADPNIIVQLKECLELIEPNRELIKQLDLQREELREKYACIIKERLTTRKKKSIHDYENKIIMIQNWSKLYFELKKVYVNKIFMLDKNEDIDEIIKKYKKKSYPKNSVYYSILQKMKKKLPKIKEISEEDDAEIEGDDNFQIYENGIDIEEIGNDNEFEEIVNDVEIEIVNDEDLEESIHSEEKEDETEDLDVYEIRENDQENENEEDDINNINEEFEEQILYYRKLLSQQLGFQFDENKYCKLVYQEYIPKQ